MIDTQNNLKPCWEEKKCAEMIRAAKRSEWTKDIFSDADHFISEGYSAVVALKMSLNYWLS